jgi:hypothetical protein
MRKRLRFTLVLLLSVFGLHEHAAAECVDYGSTLRWVASVATARPALRVAAAGDLLLVANDYAGLQVIDASNPEAPRIIGSYLTPGLARDVAAAGHLAFVADQFSGLEIVDVAIPTAPRFVGSFTSRGARGVAVQGSYAYLANLSEFVVIDVSDPAQPRLAGRWSTTWEPSNIAVEGSLALVTGLNHGFQIFDISNPAAPSLKAEIPLQTCTDVALRGNFAYVCAASEGLIVYDISNPSQPRRLGTAPVDPYAEGVALGGAHAYVGAGYGVSVVDVTDPDRPAVTASVGLRAIATRITVSGDLVLVGSHDDGVQVIRRGILPPLRLGRATGFAPSCVALAGSYACVLDFGAFNVIDVSDPYQPALVGSVHTSLFCSDIAIRGTFAFLADYAAGFRVVEFENPAAPALVTLLPSLGGTREIELAGTYAIVAADSGLGVIDISSPRAPTIAGRLRLERPIGIAMVSHYVYVESNTGLQIVDVSNPRSPVLVRQVPAEFSASHLVVAGNLAFARARDNGLRVLDVSDPAFPILVGASDSPAMLTSLHRVGNVLYATAGFTGLLVYDIQNPRVPHLSGGVDTEGFAEDLAATPDYVYVANSGFGLDIFPSQCSTPTPVMITDIVASNVELGILLRWQTSDESLPGFELRRARGNDAFESLGEASHEAPNRWEFLDSRIEPRTTYTYAIRTLGEEGFIAGTIAVTTPQAHFALLPPEPNPAREYVRFRFELPSATPADLRVYDVAGRLVRRLQEGNQGGDHLALWDGRDGVGRRVPNGLYLVQLRAGGRVATARVLVLR